MKSKHTLVALILGVFLLVSAPNVLSAASRTMPVESAVALMGEDKHKDDKQDPGTGEDPDDTAEPREGDDSKGGDTGKEKKSKKRKWYFIFIIKIGVEE